MATVQAIFLRDGYARGKGKGRGLTGWYRDLSVKEAKQLSWNGSLYAIDKSGCVREVRLNGKPKVWKTRPGCVLSLKYGLREYFTVGTDTLTDQEAISTHSPRIVVPVRHAFSDDTPCGVVTDYVLENEVS